MDPSQYHQNGLSNNNSPYSLPGVSPHQLQQGSSHPQHTLPPLQGSQHAMMYNGSAPHTPRTPATPNTPGSANNMGNFPQQLGGQRNYPMMAGNSYPQQNQGYPTSRPMTSQAPTAMSYPQPIAPAPASRMIQPLRPMPPNGLQHMQGGMQQYGQNNMLSQMPDMEPPTHVVGSQGRRGILPSAPGRPAVSQTGTGTGKNALIPAKDADGKFPCPHCTKTYLHAKHLKRHLLRHTGDRPYMCVLCRDTFSRSDILKRHFQKCSIRRGNPTGASHLSHAQAHLKKSHPGPHKSSNSMSNENDLMGVNGMSNVFGVVPNGELPDAASGLTDQQAQDALSRSNSLKRLSAGDGRDGRGMAGLGSGTSNRASFDQSYGGALGGSPMPGTGMNPSLAFNLPHGQNGHSYGQGQGYEYVSHGNSSSVQSHSASGQDSWSQMFQPSGPDGFMSAYNPSITNSHVSIKTEPSITNSAHVIFSGIYPGIATSSSIPSWNLQNDPLEEISSRLIYFCFPSEQIIGRSNDIRTYLSADNIKHFLEHFTSFQGHFPILHIPTFRIAEAFDGLLLAMICIGAVYSSRMASTQVREMMELAKSVIERNSPIYSIVSREQTRDSGFGDETIGSSTIGSSKSDLEQITAIFMMQVLFTWHGTPLQREKARREFPLVAEIARRAGLTKPMTSSPFSVLHQPNATVENFNAASFDWNAWVEQEKRSRLMLSIFLEDIALSLYFNMTPQFEKDEIRLPLPADDAAWDAATSAECAEALGLHGPVVARSRNPEGSRRPKQPEMHSALNALMHNVWDLQPGTTNLYSKFILVHALHIELWTALRQMSLQESDQLNPQNLSFPSSGTSTPINQHDWVQRVDPTSSGLHSASTSGRATPVIEASSQSSLLRSINSAFDKWKKAWDEDMAAQYPPSSMRYHRFGFCRDAVHFYWLAKYLMKNNHSMDWKIAPDQRFAQVINLLKSVKSWVVSDSAKRGEELGSVSDIGSDYGATDLTLDMAQLFRPINKQIDSPVPGVHTSIGAA